MLYSLLDNGRVCTNVLVMGILLANPFDNMKKEKSAMTIFDGRYSWDGKKNDSGPPIAWFPGTYNLKIVTCSSPAQGVEQLKQHICLFSETGEGQSIYANPEKFAQQICHDFSLNIERVLWVEEFSDDKKVYDIIHFSKSGRLSNAYFYRAKRRPALEEEIHMIQRELAGFEDK